jgi:2,3-dihydroxybiphenyl 1,2-dioxygenase
MGLDHAHPRRTPETATSAEEKNAMIAHVSRLEYIGLEVTDLPAWEEFATSILGLRSNRANDATSTLLSMDQRHHRISVRQGEVNDLVHLGWHVGSEAELEAIAQRLQDGGSEVTWGSEADAHRRGAERMVCTRDPSGLVAEVVFGSYSSREASPRNQRFVTGKLGVGHVALFVPEPEATIRFYVDGLGLELSDTIDLDLGPAGQRRATFLHAGPRHHALAIVPVAAPTRLHHLMLQLEDIDEVGRSYDLCLERGVPIEMSLGRHTNDEMTSFYMRSPAGFQVELGCGGRVIDDETWQVTHYDRPSRWGHRPPTPPAA